MDNFARREKSDARKSAKNAKHVPLLEWRTCESDIEWQAGLPLTPTITIPHPGTGVRSSWLIRYWPLVTALLLILAIAGGWTWHLAQQGKEQIEAELRARVEADLWRATEASEQIRGTIAVEPVGAAQPLSNTVHVLAHVGESAVVQLVLQPASGGSTLRQTRVYRWSESGWQRISPMPAYWGASRRLETEHFIFHYYARDEAAVVTGAAELDHIYQELAPCFRLFLPQEAKIQVEVDPSHLPGAIVTPPTPDTPLEIASPATYLAPVELSDSDLLVQSLVLALLSLAEIDTNQQEDQPANWQPLADGLRLWQLWQLDVPLAAWREPLVPWVFAQTALPPPQAFSLPPTFSADFCAAHRLWMASALELMIPVVCNKHSPAQEYLLAWAASYRPLLTLAKLAPTATAPSAGYPSRPATPGYAVVLASVFDYIELTYGQEKLSLLVTSLPDHTSWQTVIPQVFGVSARDFEAGWQSYLVQHYKVS